MSECPSVCVCGVFVCGVSVFELENTLKLPNYLTTQISIMK